MTTGRGDLVRGIGNGVDRVHDLDVVVASVSTELAGQELGVGIGNEQDDGVQAAQYLPARLGESGLTRGGGG